MRRAPWNWWAGATAPCSKARWARHWRKPPRIAPFTTRPLIASSVSAPSKTWPRKAVRPSPPPSPMPTPLQTPWPRKTCRTQPKTNRLQPVPAGRAAVRAAAARPCRSCCCRVTRRHWPSACRKPRAAGLTDIWFFTQKGYYTQKIQQAMGLELLDREISDTKRQTLAPERARELERVRKKLFVEVRNFVERKLALYGTAPTRQLHDDFLQSQSLQHRKTRFRAHARHRQQDRQAAGRSPLAAQEKAGARPGSPTSARPCARTRPMTA